MSSCHQDPLPPDTLLNVNCPAGEPTGIEVTHLGKRLYNDEMKLVDEEPENGAGIGTRSTASQPSFEDEAGSDLSAIARERISVTPVHFDLTDRPSLDRLKAWDFTGMLGRAETAAESAEARRSGDGAEGQRSEPRSYGGRSGTTTTATTSATSRPSTTRLRRVGAGAGGARGRAIPSWCTPDSPTQRVGAPPLDPVLAGRPTAR